VTSADFRFSRFDPMWRAADGRWPADSWSDISDFFVVDASLRDIAEYEGVERRYLDTICHCLLDGTAVVTARRVEFNPVVAGQLSRHGLLVDLPDRFPAMRTADDVRVAAQACMRHQIWCELVSESAHVAFGHDLYVRVRAQSPDDASWMKRIATRNGLFVEDVAYLEFDE
jgi:phage tail protein X